MALRIQSLVGHHPHTSQEAAERYIRKVDRQRRRWVRAMYGAEVGDTLLYDLTINLRAISLDTACVMVTEMAQQPHYEVTDAVRAQLVAFAATCRQRLDAIVAVRR